MRDVYCSDQFENLHIRSASSGTVIIGPCCNTAGIPIDPNHFDYNDNRFLQEIRQHTQLNVRPAACVNCWNHEDAGGLSRRLNGRSDPGHHRGVGLRRLDYTTQNICNLACVHCSSYSSSLWASIAGDASDQKESYQDKIGMARSLDLANIEHIHITGGEPLMTREHVKLLGLVQAAGRLEKISLSYNTNCTIEPDAEVLALWSKVTKVNVIASIDAVGPAAEIIRWPCEWPVVDRTVRNLALMRSQQLPNLALSLNVSVANYNFLELPDIVAWTHEIDPTIFINWQLVNQDWMHPSSLPLEHWPRARAITQSHPGLEEWSRSFVDSAQRRPDHWNATMRWLDRMDQQRHHAWRDILKVGRV